MGHVMGRGSEGEDHHDGLPGARECRQKAIVCPDGPTHDPERPPKVRGWLPGEGWFVSFR
jgi:hypothetical protein